MRAFVVVKGTPVFRMALTFAGRRRNEDLGRSAPSSGVSSPFGARTGDSGCPLVPEEGNVVGTCSQSPCTSLESANNAPRAQEDASFARSKDPCTSIVTTLRRRKSSKVARSVWYRGRANPRKREEPATGLDRTDVARLAACHRLRKGESVMRQKRMEVVASLPARNESSGLVARTS